MADMKKKHCVKGKIGVAVDSWLQVRVDFMAWQIN